MFWQLGDVARASGHFAQALSRTHTLESGAGGNAPHDEERAREEDRSRDEERAREDTSHDARTREDPSRKEERGSEVQRARELRAVTLAR